MSVELDEVDKKELLRLESAFNAIVDLIDRDFKVDSAEVGGVKIGSFYAVVFNAATRQKICSEQLDQYALCEILYARYKEILHTYLNRSVERMPKGMTSDSQLTWVIKRWEGHKIALRWLERTFAYLSRYYIVHQDKPLLHTVGLQAFNEVLFQAVMKPVRDTVFALLLRERRGDEVDKNLIKSAADMFLAMSYDPTEHYYEKHFFEPFVAATSEHYMKESLVWVAEDDAMTYLRRVSQRLQEEHARCQAYLHPSSEPHVIHAVEEELLNKHRHTIIEMEGSGFTALLRDNRNSDISLMFQLYARTANGLDSIAILMKSHALGDGNNVVKKYCSATQDVDSRNYVLEMISLHDKYSSLLRQVLGNHPVFQKAIKDAFEVFINQPLTFMEGQQNTGKMTCSEMLAQYCDTILRSGGEKMTDEDVDESFEKVVGLFSFINDKDLFQEFCRKLLSRRVLTTTVNEEFERNFITKLKLRAGAPFTSKLEGMLQDKNNSLEQQKRFKDWLANHEMDLGFEPSVQVLTLGYWPTFRADEAVVPSAVAYMMSSFQKFYGSTTENRILTWINSLSTATIHASFAKGPKEMQMSAYQAAVLVSFNTKDKWTLKDLVEALNLERDEVRKALHSFSLLKLKVLQRAGSATTGIVDTDEFSVNDDFTCATRKLKVPALQTKANTQQQQQVTQQVEEDRRHAIEACLVRIMKSRKTLEHTALVTECLHQLSTKFKPDPKIVKRRIEELITREFIERVPDKPSTYMYLA